MTTGGIPRGPRWTGSCLFLGLWMVIVAQAAAQPEITQWGSLRGLRVEGHLFAFESNLELRQRDGSVVARTGHYANRSEYSRDGSAQQVKVTLDGVLCTQRVEPVEADRIRIDLMIEGAPGSAGSTLNWVVRLPGAEFAQSQVHWELASRC